MKFIGLDVGSSFIKGTVLDVDRMSLGATKREPFPTQVGGLPPGHFEVNLEVVMLAVRQVVDSLAQAGSQIDGVLVSSQMDGAVLVRPDGSAASNYISWRDQRTTQKMPGEDGTWLASVRSRLGHTELDKMGGDLHPGSPIALLFWLGQQGCLTAGLELLSIGDFVVRTLCKTAKAAVDPTLAVGTLDLTKGTWNTPAFAALGLRDVVWPELGSVWGAVGSVGINGRQIPCYPAVGDQQAALAGAYLSVRELSLNISTGSQMSMLAERFSFGTFQVRPYFNGRFINTITHLPAGRSLDVLLDLIQLANDETTPAMNLWPKIINAVESSQSSDLSASLTFYDGPLGRRGSITNISTENLSLGGLFRAAFRSMAENYAQCAGRLSPSRAWDRLVFSGGLAQNLRPLRKTIEETLGGSSRLCQSPEDTLLGLLIIATVICGRAEDFEQATQLARSRENSLLH